MLRFSAEGRSATATKCTGTGSWYYTTNWAERRLFERLRRRACLEYKKTFKKKRSKKTVVTERCCSHVTERKRCSYQYIIWIFVVGHEMEFFRLKRRQQQQSWAVSWKGWDVNTRWNSKTTSSKISIYFPGNHQRALSLLKYREKERARWIYFWLLVLKIVYETCPVYNLFHF